MASLLLARTARRALQRSARSPCLAAPRSRRQCWRALSTKDDTDKEEEAAAPAPDAAEAEPVDEAAAALELLGRDVGREGAHEGAEGGDLGLGSG